MMEIHKHCPKCNGKGTRGGTTSFNYDQPVSCEECHSTGTILIGTASAFTVRPYSGTDHVVFDHWEDAPPPVDPTAGLVPGLVVRRSDWPEWRTMKIREVAGHGLFGQVFRSGEPIRDSDRTFYSHWQGGEQLSWVVVG